MGILKHPPHFLMLHIDYTQISDSKLLREFVETGKRKGDADVVDMHSDYCFNEEYVIL